MRTALRHGFKTGLLAGVCVCAGALGMVAAAQVGNQGQPLDRQSGDHKITQSQDGKTVYLWRLEERTGRVEFVSSAEADENQMNRNRNEQNERDPMRNRPTRTPN